LLLKSGRVREINLFTPSHPLTLLTIRSTVYVYPLLIGNSHKPSHLPRAAVHQRVIEHSLDGYPLSNPHLRSTLIISGNDQKKKGKNIPPFSSGRTPWLQHPETLVARNQTMVHPKAKNLILASKHIIVVRAFLSECAIQDALRQRHGTALPDSEPLMLVEQNNLL
jgi:hypothetical protein